MLRPYAFAGKCGEENRVMALMLRSYEPHDFAALHKLDQACFPPGISYSKTTLRYFLTLASADCVVAVEGDHIAGFVLSEENPPVGAHYYAGRSRRKQRPERGREAALLRQLESNLFRAGSALGLLETANGQ